MEWEARVDICKVQKLKCRSNVKTNVAAWYKASWFLHSHKAVKKDIHWALCYCVIKRQTHFRASEVTEFPECCDPSLASPLNLPVACSMHHSTQHAATRPPDHPRTEMPESIHTQWSLKILTRCNLSKPRRKKSTTTESNPPHRIEQKGMSQAGIEPTAHAWKARMLPLHHCDLVATWDMLMGENFGYMNLQIRRSRMRLQALCAACATPPRVRKEHPKSQSQSRLHRVRESQDWKIFSRETGQQSKACKAQPESRSPSDDKENSSTGESKR